MGLTTWINRCLGRDMNVDPMVELQYQTMIGAAQRMLPKEVVSRPELVAARNEFRKIEAIEQELINQVKPDVARQLLKPFFEQPDPWLRAFAAKAFYRIDAKEALVQLKQLVEHPSRQCQLPAVWALGELASASALELIMTLAWSSHAEVQHAVLRCLVQIENKQQVPQGVERKFGQLLSDLRKKSDWIL